MRLTSVLGIVAVCVALRCEAWPQRGQMANADEDCAKYYYGMKCVDAGDYTCAKLEGVYVKNKTMCDFCETYGRTEAIVYHVGAERECSGMKVGEPLNFDPECEYYFHRSNADECPGPDDEEEVPHCAEIPNNPTVAYGDSKCKFCTQYGSYTRFRFCGTGPKCIKLRKLRPGK